MKKALLLLCCVLMIIILSACGSIQPAELSNSDGSTPSGINLTPEASNTSEFGSAAVTSAGSETAPGEGDSSTPLPTQAGTASSPTSSKAPANKTASPPASSAPPRTSTPVPVTDPPVTSAPTPTKPSQPTAPVYTQKDYDDIINAVRDYADSQTKLKFVWNPSIKMDDFHGYLGTPNLTRDGKDRVIQTLKYHVDMIVTNLTGGNGGVPSTTVEYNIIWYIKNSETFFVLLYG